MNEERQYRELRRLGQKLHIPMPEAFIELEVRDKDGRLVQRHKQRSHSWVRNAYNLLFCSLAAVDGNDSTFEAGKLSIKDTGGTIRYSTKPIAELGTTSMLTAGYGYTAAAGVITSGIVVGSGTNAESFEDYVLQTLIANGTGGGQLSYVASELYSYSYNAGTKVLTATHIRYINNNSGGAVGINEVGLILSGYAGGVGRYWYNSRDKLGSTVTVPDTGQLKVTYTIQLTYPA
jgi:hypothetical protein